MILCTNGSHVITTYQDTEWNDNAQYAEQPGITNAFRVNPRLVTEVFGQYGELKMTHEEAESLALEEVAFNVQYT